MCYKSLPLHRGVACETNDVPHVWIQHCGTLRTLQYMTSPHELSEPPSADTHDTVFQYLTQP